MASPSNPHQRPHEDSVYRTLLTVGDAWSWLVLRDAVLFDVRRFDEFQRHSGAAKATLSARLQKLVDGGVLHRSGPRGYELTAAGEDFLGCLLTAWRWGATWYPAPGGGDELTHLTCGNPLAAVLRCRACDRVVDAHDVSWSAHSVVETEPIPTRQRAPRRELLERGGPSPVARTLAVIGDWWTNLVIREAFFGTHRFDNFERNLGAATNILASRLSLLVREGLLERVPYQSRPVRHEYRLTAKGRDLYHVPLAMSAWGERWPTPAPAPVALVHRPCGNPLQTQLSCARCAGDVTRATIAVSAAPARR